MGSWQTVVGWQPMAVVVAAAGAVAVVEVAVVVVSAAAVMQQMRSRTLTSSRCSSSEIAGVDAREARVKGANPKPTPSINPRVSDATRRAPGQYMPR